MYLFAHYICFYSNLFGFETKKIIHFNEVTSVRRAKAAAIFPTAIEIIAGGKKFFFTSFLSRDEAFKLINDGWSQNNSDIKSITDEQVNFLLFTSYTCYHLSMDELDAFWELLQALRVLSNAGKILKKRVVTKCILPQCNRHISQKKIHGKVIKLVAKFLAA